METKVIAVEWAPNWWKSTLISHVSDFYGSIDANVKVYPEVARVVMEDFPGSEHDQDKFQEIIYHRESERLHRLEQDIKSNIYDLILVDRTSLSGWIFWMFNEDSGASTKLNPSVFNPSLYSSVILFTDPIGLYKWDVDAFKWYNDWALNDLFKKYIPYCYPQTKQFSNYLEQEEEVKEHIASILLNK